jgi:hypothetical protein
MLSFVLFLSIIPFRVNYEVRGRAAGARVGAKAVSRNGSFSTKFFSLDCAFKETWLLASFSVICNENSFHAAIAQK